MTHSMNRPASTDTNGNGDAIADGALLVTCSLLALARGACLGLGAAPGNDALFEQLFALRANQTCWLRRNDDHMPELKSPARPIIVGAR
jgi:hypothetical protein